jgi:hypothetical protein
VTRPRERSTGWLLATVFFLVLTSQWLVTPLGEGLDVYGHVAYATFVEREGRWPTATEPSMRADVARWRRACLGPDYLCPGFYGRWRATSPDERTRAAAEALVADPDAPNVADNYQAQHPPLYYLVLAPVTRLLRHAALDIQVFWLGLLSIVIAALAVPLVHRALAAAGNGRGAVLAVLAVAWFPNLLPFLARVSNDTLAFPLVSALVLLVTVARPTTRSMAAAGAVLGLGLWTKSYFAALVPAVLVWAVARKDADGSWCADWRSLVSCAAALAIVAGPLFAHNLFTTGHLLPLLEARATHSLAPSERLGALFLVDPAWFVLGMARNFIWVGYWSFVSPAYTFYVAVAIAMCGLFILAARRAPASPHFTRLSPTVVVALMVAGFLAGMGWHAALFTLDARVRGLERFSGNEGYYLNILLPGLAVVVSRAMLGRGTARRPLAALAGFVVVMMAANLWARAAMLVFWGGGAPIVGYERLLPWRQAWPALLDGDTWASAFSLPGVVSPWLGGVALVLALGLSGALVRWTLRSGEDAPGLSSP